MLFGRGLGVHQDWQLAHYWLNIASSQGHAEARLYLKNLERSMLPRDIAEAQALADIFEPVCELECR